MKVKELINLLKKLPNQDKTIVVGAMFDEPVIDKQGVSFGKAYSDIYVDCNLPDYYALYGTLKRKDSYVDCNLPDYYALYGTLKRKDS